MKAQPDLSRRRLLVTGSGALAAAGLVGVSRVAAQTAPQAPAAASQAKPLPAYVAWKDADSMIVHTPTTIETKRTAFGVGMITPAERLFIRNNLPAPDVSIVANRDAWQLAVEGVRKPSTLTVAELKTLGLETIATVLQCSGNGRSYFPTKPAGTRWTVGAAGNVLWSGVPVRAVAQALGGPANGARFITGTGGEKLPDGIDPKTVVVERSVPISMLDDALLAWELNGEPLPHAHGGPLRLIIPGYSGVNNIKYVKRLAFTRDETDAAIQRTNYRMTAPGTKGDPSFPAVWEMGPKSWINSPAARSGHGATRLGSDTRRGDGWHAGTAKSRRVARRRQDVARSKLYRPQPWSLCMASVRAASGPETGHLRPGIACDGFAGQRPSRSHSGQRRRLSE